ncbi:hypothetical protein MCUN1_001939 [Malassezia cuniculi]|uniref:DDHD domain-containing protein n=1 Tax=Malassezia cuniculi TaxID=948313 RepID=A0AAF0EU57_9BASI|nr:hypothetical protein MCUN1_001939 [Malassezia cuniculi]
MSSPEFRAGAAEVAMPPKRARWFHSSGTRWVTFSDADDATLEEWWAQHGADVQQRTDEPDEGKTDENATPSSRRSWIPESISSQLWNAAPEGANVIPPPPPPQSKGHVPHFTDPDEPEETRKFKVQVMEDHLYDVDVQRGILYPALWTGLEQSVLRATWFYVSGDCTVSPIAWNSALARDLDEAYEKVEPWTLAQRLRALNAESRQPNVSHDLPSVFGGARVSFDDAYTGRIYLANIGSAILSYLRDSVVIRGFDRVQQVLERLRKGKTNGMLEFVGYKRPDDDSTSSLSWASLGDAFMRTTGQPSKDKDEQVLDPGIDPALMSSEKSSNRPYGADKGGSTASTDTEGDETEPDELEVEEDDTVEVQPNLDGCPTEEQFGAVPGAGPATGAVSPSKLSNVKPTVGDILKDSAQQYKTVQIVFCIHGIGQKLSEDYASLDFVHDVERLQALCWRQMGNEDMKSMIGNGQIKFIPVSWRRLLTFDPPDRDYVLSDLMLESSIPAVRSIIGKVLLDIPFYFSKHRTAIKKMVLTELNRLFRLYIQRNPDFLERGGKVSILGHSMGSMLATDILMTQPTEVPPLSSLECPGIHSTHEHLLFNVEHLFLIGSPVALLLYLDGNELIARRRPGIPEDVSSDQVGERGCLAARYIYNIYSATDPVSLRLSATVDPAYARLMAPLVLTRNPLDMAAALEQPRISVKLWTEKNADEEDKMSTDISMLESGERKFFALNPYGCLDFALETSKVNQFTQYLDMFQAHMCYWTSVPFANFLLKQLVPREDK